MTKKKLITIGDDDDSDNIIQMIRDVAGEDVHDWLCHHHGGTRICLPTLRRFNEESAVSKQLGFEMAKKVMDAVGVDQGTQEFDVPLGKAAVKESLKARITELLAENGLSADEIARMTGVHTRTIWRHKALMRKRGEKLGDPTLPRRPNPALAATSSIAESIVRQLLLEGHSPSLLRNIVKIPPAVILTIRAELLRQGKLK
ncbi:helix-turn-helix domain-containing protein [Agrobacterium pusense]|uniref:helix-turn-helix domain-containing protein n=1 Tax=Agrobacterium pusense TaxID=648995 RepID=UPI0032DB0B76